MSALGHVFVEGLNDLAARADAGLPAFDNLAPESVTSAGWWFAGAARDFEVSSWSPEMLDALSPGARCRASCSEHRACYPCAFERHDLCAHGCEATA